MSENLAKLAKYKKQANGDGGGKDDLPHQEKKALDTLQREAEETGATLETAGEGGLPSSLVLGVLRRDKYQCKRCGSKKNLTMHHKGRLENPKSKWLAKKGKINDINNVVTICAECHDSVHEEDREES